MPLLATLSRPRGGRSGLLAVLFFWDWRNNLVIEFGQQLALGIAFGLAVKAMFLFGV